MRLERLLMEEKNKPETARKGKTMKLMGLFFEYDDAFV
jgi:hypothetical protein